MPITIAPGNRWLVSKALGALAGLSVPCRAMVQRAIPWSLCEHSRSRLNSSHTAHVLLYRFWIAGIGEDACSRNGRVKSFGDRHISVAGAIQRYFGGLGMKRCPIEPGCPGKVRLQ